MNKSLVTGLVIGAIAAVGAGAVAGLKMINKGPEYAQVLKVTPITKTIHTPRQECHDEQVTHTKPPKDENRLVGTGVGAVVGGLLGHQIGGGSTKVVTTVAGAAAGGYAGNQIEQKVQQGETYTTTEQHCTTVNDTTEKQVGYQVRYSLNGAEHTVKMDHDPGEKIPVRNGQLVLEDSAESAK